MSNITACCLLGLASRLPATPPIALPFSFSIWLSRARSSGGGACVGHVWGMCRSCVGHVWSMCGACLQYVWGISGAYVTYGYVYVGMYGMCVMCV